MMRIPLKLYHHKSPYTGWFRHAPPSRLPRQLLLQQQKKYSPTKFLTPSSFVDGRLKGGAPYLSLDGQFLLKRLASWLISEEQQDPFTHAKALAMFPQDYDDDEEESSSDDDDDSVSTIGTHLQQSMLPHELLEAEQEEEQPLSVSSLAEAYYAHQLATEVAVLQQQQQQQPEDDADDPHRLDYVITQMDIARMARNASRHLDVESILSLPTITYQSSLNNKKKERQEEEREDEMGWSWTIVPPSDDDETRKDDDDESQQQHSKKSVCVICLEQFVDGDRLRVLPCNHSFHVGCIDRWLSGSSSFEECYTSGCPTCKKQPNLDGSVPSWAFDRLGEAMAKRNQNSTLCSLSSSSS